MAEPAEKEPRRVDLMIQSLFQARKWLAFAAIFMATAAISVSLGQGDKTQADDGWRRTTAGWEKVAVGSASTTQHSPAFQANNTASGKAQRWDTHPAVLAMVQLSAVVALFALPAGWRFGSSGISRGIARLPRLIADSFRASAFY